MTKSRRRQDVLERPAFLVGDTPLNGMRNLVLSVRRYPIRPARDPGAFPPKLSPER